MKVEKDRFFHIDELLIEYDLPTYRERENRIEYQYEAENIHRQLDLLRWAFRIHIWGRIFPVVIFSFFPAVNFKDLLKQIQPLKKPWLFHV